MYESIGENFGLIDSFVVAIVSVILVFVVLSVIIGVCGLISKVIISIENRNKINPRVENKLLEEDDDAIAATIVASIDFYKETNKKAKLIKITRSKEEE